MLFAEQPGRKIRAWLGKPGPVPVAVRRGGGLALAVLVWRYSSKAITDLFLYGAFIAALPQAGRGRRFWRNPAGYAFILLLAYLLLSLPLSADPMASLRDLANLGKYLGFAFAIPVLFGRREALEGLLGYSAVALTLILGFDLARLAWVLRGALWSQARLHEPFILNHPNVASMMAGMAFFVLLYFAWTWRRQPLRLALCLAGMAIHLVYLYTLASRGPQLAFVLACGALLFVLPRWYLKLGIVILAEVLVVLALTHPGWLNRRFADRRTMATFSERDKVWRHTWRLAGERLALGHGYGKKVFERVYYASRPPPATFHYPHCHEYWLKILFEHGMVGVALYLAAWGCLAARLLRAVFRAPTFTARLLPATVGLLLLFGHLYGLGDFPDSVVQAAMIWLVPVALVVTAPAPGKESSSQDRAPSGNMAGSGA